MKLNLKSIKADYIVNASNTRLILGSGVSMAIKRHCGFEIQKEMAVLAPIAQGEVVITSAGKAENFKQILHAAITDIKLPTTSDVSVDNALGEGSSNILLYK